MPEETVVAAEPSLEDQLAALGQPPAPASPTTPADAPAASPEAQPPAADEPTLESQLEAIEKEIPAPEEKPQPQLSQEQQEILRVIPTAQVAEQVANLAQGYQTFTSEFAAGRFDNVEQMFSQWNPEAWEAFQEHIYTKKVASGEWVERWIADKEGNPTVNSGLKSLQREIAQLKSQLAQRGESETKAQTAARQQENSRAYQSHIEGLFNQIKFSEADRPFVSALLHNRIATNPAIFQAVREGKLSAVNGLFVQAVREYTSRDKATATAKDAKLTQQAEKKAPLPTGNPVTQLGAITDEAIKSAPKAQREALREQQMDQELAALAQTRRR